VADVRALTPSEAADRVVPLAAEVRAYLDQQQQRLAGALRTRLAAAGTRLESLAASRVFRRPLERIQLQGRQLDEIEGRLARAAGHRIEIARAQLDAHAGRLESLSPLAVLGRGFSLTTRLDDRRIVRRASQVSVGDRLRTRLAEGELVSRVEDISPAVAAERGASERDSLHGSTPS
jgi:exodeoxyribonuclease VII large subunit